MKKTLLFLLFFPFLLLHGGGLPLEENGEENDQFEMVLGIPAYVLYKAIEFAREHHFRYLKILSFEFDADEHHLTYLNKNETKKGKYFELKEESLMLALTCFKGKPDDPQIIDAKKYQSFAKEVEEELSGLVEGGKLSREFKKIGWQKFLQRE